MKKFGRTLVTSVRSFVRDDQGTEVLEWGLVCGLIVIGAIAAIVLIGPKVKTTWDNINAAVPTP